MSGNYLGKMMIAALIVLSSAISYAQDTSSEDSFLLEIKSLQNNKVDSPAVILEKVSELQQVADGKEWPQAFLQLKILRARMVAELRDLAAAKTIIDTIDINDTELVSFEDSIKIQLIRLKISDNFDGVSEIKTQHEYLLSTIDTIQTPALKGDVYHSVGVSLQRLEEYGAAIDSFRRAYEVYESVDDTENMLRPLNALAATYTIQRDYETSLRYYLLAYEQVQRLDNAYLQSILEYNIGYAHYRKGDDKDAEAYYLQAINTGEKAQFDAVIVYSRQQLGELKLKEEKWQETIDLNLYALDFYKKNGDTIRQFFSANSMVKAALGLGDFELVDRYLEMSQELVNTLDVPMRRIDYNNLVAQVLYEQQDYKSAYEVLRDNIALQEATFDAEQLEQAQKLKVEFDTALLQNQNEALKATESLNQAIIDEQQKKERFLNLTIAITLFSLVVIAWTLIKQTRMRGKFEQLSLVDVLTNSPNRRAIINNADQAFTEAQAHEEQTLFIGIIDIDFFKDINDKYGHETGDQVLLSFADACRNNLRQGEYFGRYGGEEWLLVLMDAKVEHLHKIFERIREKVNNHHIDNMPDEYQITFCLGVAQYDRSIDKSVNDLIKRADQQLYRAKQSGRDKLCIDQEA